MPFGWGIVSTGKHPDIKIAPAMAAADGGGARRRLQPRSAPRGGVRTEARRTRRAHQARRPPQGLRASTASSWPRRTLCMPSTSSRWRKPVSTAPGQKPMATKIADAVRMLQACRRARITLGIAFNLRQHPAYIRARELVAAGTLGRIVLAQAQWAFGVRGRDPLPARTPLTQWWDTPELIGGASTMMGTGVHSVDLLRFVLGAEVDEITAVTDGQTAARPLQQLACLTLRFGSGMLGQVVASRLLPDSRNDFRVYGITGLIAGHHCMWLACTGRFEIAERHRQRDGRLPGSATAGNDVQSRGLPARGRHRRPASSDRPGRAARR